MHHPEPYVEPDWTDWPALLAPWPDGPTAAAALAGADVFGILRPWAPLLVGTFPIGLTVPGSDLDIACHMPDPASARPVLERAFGAPARLGDRGGLPTLVLGFTAAGHAIEVFGQPIPARRQFGHRHLRAEHVLLWRHGDALRQAVLDLKRAGMKTEPAFARALGLPAGDPYRLLLDHADAMAAEMDLGLRF